MDDRPAEEVKPRPEPKTAATTIDETGVPAVDEKRAEQVSVVAEELKTPEEREDEDRSALKEWVELLVRAGVWALLIYVFLFQISIVDGRSMETTFHHSDRLVIDKLTYRLGEIRRLDVIVFEAIDTRSATRVPKDYIKRVIGLPGDTVEIHGGSIHVNGQKIEDAFGPTYANRFRDPSFKGVYKVPPKQYFVMGDNREDSKDSRVDDTSFMGRETLGFVPGRQIRGLVRLRFWPSDKWTWFSRK